VLAEVRKTGTRSIDLWSKVHGTQRDEAETLGQQRLAELLREHDVNVPLTTRYDLGPFKLGPEIHFLRGIGGQVVVTGSKGPTGLSGDALRREVKKFVELMKPNLSLAAETGVTIAIENHGETLVESPDALRWLAEYSQGLPLGIALAPYHLRQDPHMIGDLIRDLQLKLTLLYAWQYGLGCTKPMPKAEELKQLPGRGDLDFLPILQALHAISYNGWTEILMHPTPRGLPILETAEAVTSEINLARRYLDQLGSQ